MQGQIKPIRWGIVGCGDVTEVKSGPAYQQVEGFELSAVMARTPGKAKDFAMRHRVPRYFEDAQQLIHDPNIDAVYIATPPDSHLQYALEVAQAGKICSIEKPMALNYSECKVINAAFQKDPAHLFIAYYRRCLPAFRQIKDWLQQRLIGDVRHLDWQYTRPASDIDLTGEPNWRTEKTIAPGGYFDDIACHGLDIFTFLLGNVEKVKGFSVNQQGLYSANDAISTNMLFKSGTTATCGWNFGCFQRKDLVTLSGSEGFITFSIFGEENAVLTTQSMQQELSMVKPSPIQLPYVSRMRDQILSDIPHPCTGESAAHTSWIMDEILQTT